MSESKDIPPADEKKVPTYRLKPSRNQKKRSKLQQSSDETAAPVPEVEPAEPAAPPPHAPSPLLRHNRLKRSGHMHEDLTKPLPEDRAERDPAY